MILASLGLGSSFTFSLWLTEYHWLFLVVTLALLGFAFYRAYVNWAQTGLWSRRLLYTTAALSIGLLIYSLVAS